MRGAGRGAGLCRAGPGAGLCRARARFRRLRRAARTLALENGALCDELARTQAKWLRARRERRFLLHRLLRHLGGAAGTGGAGDVTPEVTGRRVRRGGARDGGKDGARSTEGSTGVRDGVWSMGSTGEWGRSAGSRDDWARSMGSTDWPRDDPRDELRSTAPRDWPTDGSKSTGPRVGSRDDPRDWARSTGSTDWPRDDEARPTGSRMLGSRSTGSRDGANDGVWSTASRDWPRDDDSRSMAPRDDPRDDPTPNGANPDLPPAAILETPEDPSSPTAPPAAILSTTPRRRGTAAAMTLPLTLGPLTVHSLGVARAGPGGAAAILPVGFCSSRLLATGGRCRAGRRRRYVCRVGAGPRCEVEDEAGRVLAVGATPDACHAHLLRALGEAGGRPRGTMTSPPPGAGDEFFGLSHPAVRRLLCGDAGAFVPPEDDDDDDDDEDDDDDDDDDDEEEDDGAAPAFGYADVFLGSPAGSDE